MICRLISSTNVMAFFRIATNLSDHRYQITGQHSREERVFLMDSCRQLLSGEQRVVDGPAQVFLERRDSLVEGEFIGRSDDQEVDVTAAGIGSGGHRSVDGGRLDAIDLLQGLLKRNCEPVALEKQRQQIFEARMRGLNADEDLPPAPVTFDEINLFEQGQFSLGGLKRHTGASRDLSHMNLLRGVQQKEPQDLDASGGHELCEHA